MCGTDTPLVVWQQPSPYPSEPVFVARPGGIDEDDGVVLSAVLDGPKAQSCLLLLDANARRSRLQPRRIQGAVQRARPVLLYAA
eukprot:5315777-Prymnesium_polylepis.2